MEDHGEGEGGGQKTVKSEMFKLGEFINQIGGA